MSSSALISAVFRRRPLWDPLDVHHHNRTVIGALWQEVAEELNINTMVGKAKWRGLRDYYRQQLRRNMEVGAYCPGWAHFEEMSFLEGTMNGRPPKHPRDTVKEEMEPQDDQEIDVSEALEQKWSPPSSNSQPAWSPQPRGGRVKQDQQDDSESDDDLHFFKSLIPDLKGLPRATKSYIRLRIQQVVHEEIYARSTRKKNT